jgi:hypothetical protein
LASIRRFSGLDQLFPERRRRQMQFLLAQPHE